MSLTIRELRETSQFEQAGALFDKVWKPEPGTVIMPTELMAALAHAGCYVAGAFDGTDLVGASVGFRGAGASLHSHVTGVTAMSRGVGYQLKMHQRDWCLRHGLTTIQWTYDPLVRRNAHFNLVKLGARPEEYLIDFYGELRETLNAGDPTDRLLAVWRLTEPSIPNPDSPATSSLSPDSPRPNAPTESIGRVEPISPSGRGVSTEPVDSPGRGGHGTTVDSRKHAGQEEPIGSSGHGGLEDPAGSQGRAGLAEWTGSSGRAGLADRTGSPGHDGSAESIPRGVIGSMQSAGQPNSGGSAKSIGSPERGVPVKPAGPAEPILDEEGRVRSVSTPTVLVATPPDIEALRVRDPNRAREWRLAMRETLGELMSTGGKVVGFTSEGHYIVTRR